MTRIIRKAVVVVLILVGAGVAAAATSPVIIGPPVGIAVAPSSQTQTGTTTTTTGGVTTTTVGDTTTVIGGTTNPITGGTTTPGTTTPGATTTIEQLVAVTRTVQPGAPVNAFVVPAANRLVLTDVVITNAGTTPACGASVGTGGATGSAAADLANTGVLCIPAQTSLTLALTTGLEFTAAQNVVLGNQASTGTTGGPLFYHLRGFLLSGA